MQHMKGKAANYGNMRKKFVGHKLGSQSTSAYRGEQADPVTIG